MTTENIKKEFEIRKLKNENKTILNANTLLNRQLKTLNENFEQKVNKKVEAINTFYEGYI